jgi:type II secretion system protein N
MADSQPRARRSRLVYVAYALIGLLLFLGFIAAGFPYPQAVSDGLAPMGYSVAIGAQHYSFPFGAELDNVTIAPLSPPGPAVLDSPRVIVAPSLLSILVFHPGLRVKADLFGGIVKTTARPSAGGTLLNFSLSDVQLANLKLLDQWGLALTGGLSGDGKAWIPPANPNDGKGNADLEAANLNVTPPAPLPPVAMGTAEGTFSVENQMLTIQNFKTSGGDLQLTASGTIQLGDNPSDSTLNIQFTLATTPAAAQRLAFLLAGLPHPPGGQPYQLTGTLAAPHIS